MYMCVCQMFHENDKLSDHKVNNNIGRHLYTAIVVVYTPTTLSYTIWSLQSL